MCSFKTIQTKLCRAEVKMSLLDLNNLHAEKHLSLFSLFFYWVVLSILDVYQFRLLGKRDLN